MQGREKPASGPARDLLRFFTSGSVDVGKSTLVGRLLLDCNRVLDDQLAVLRADSRRLASAEAEPDLALLLDGLEAEREQGITIDVAYRYFSTPRRSFIVADTPGHEQYTRNMATGASKADLGLIVIDARAGILTQTRRQTSIAHLLDVRHLVLAVNKMDLIGFDRARFEALRAEYEAFARKLGVPHVTAIPIVARSGDNVAWQSPSMPWHVGPTVLDLLETVDVSRPSAGNELRLPVQWVNRPDASFRGYAGTIVNGTISMGMTVVALPSGHKARISGIETGEGAVDSAGTGRAVTVVLDKELDIARGDVLVSEEMQPDVSDQLAVDIVWMSDVELLAGRQYLVKCGTQTVTGSFTSIKHKINVDTLEPVPARGLGLHDIGACNLSLTRPIVFEPYLVNRHMGSFIVIDRLSQATVAAGMIRFGLRRATNVTWQVIDVDQSARAAIKRQHAACVWLTGLSGSGKSTIANMLERQLHMDRYHTYILDGDNVRHGLNRDLGFTNADRVENIRRVAEVARLMVDAGLLVIVAFISPFRAERQMARDLFRPGEFIELFVDTPLDVCEQRDPKGLYRKARSGQLQNFTGIDSAYEPPEASEIHLRTAGATPDQSLLEVLRRLRELKIVA